MEFQITIRSQDGAEDVHPVFPAKRQTQMYQYMNSDDDGVPDTVIMSVISIIS